MNSIRAKKERNSFRDFIFRARFSHGLHPSYRDFLNTVAFVAVTNHSATMCISDQWILLLVERIAL